MEAAKHHLGEIRRSDPRMALEAIVRTITGTCIHTSARPDRPSTKEGWADLADQLTEMGVAYLLTPDRWRGDDRPRSWVWRIGEAHPRPGSPASAG